MWIIANGCGGCQLVDWHHDLCFLPSQCLVCACGHPHTGWAQCWYPLYTWCLPSSSLPLSSLPLPSSPHLFSPLLSTPILSPSPSFPSSSSLPVSRLQKVLQSTQGKVVVGGETNPCSPHWCQSDLQVFAAYYIHSWYCWSRSAHTPTHTHTHTHTHNTPTPTPTHPHTHRHTHKRGRETIRYTQSQFWYLPHISVCTMQYIMRTRLYVAMATPHTYLIINLCYF